MSNPNNVNNEDEIFDPQEMFVTLDLDDGSQLECQILTIFDVDNQNYIALVPVDNDDEVIFYRYFEDEEGNPSLENIDHDDEFDAVSDRFDELLDEEEFTGEAARSASALSEALAEEDDLYRDLNNS